MDRRTQKSIFLYLIFTHWTIGVRSSCQCIGYKPLIINAKDSQFHASSTHNTAPSAIKSTAQAWRPRREQSSWARIDLLENTLIGGTVTWGNRDANRNYYVTSYCIKYRRDGSQTWIPHSDANGSRVVFKANQNRQQAVLNDIKGNIFARYVRLYPVKFNGYPALRWELLGCVKYILPYSSPDFNPATAACGITSEHCIHATNARIRLNYKGLITQSRAANLVLSGKLLSCNNISMTIGIETGMIGCAVVYGMCEMAAEDDKCHVACQLNDRQVAQPFNLLLMINGDYDMELCTVQADLSPWKPGRSVIGDWDSFLHTISHAEIV
ncbi:hypothetical protein CAPTEDRAFT_195136 [Capitella teleta]|uniref:F5/8 type C domain-containing protein n=1 Tax=Capitella teleta TaxID=283909 RepID=R7VKN3_CAPTE|nr:hypothetical protein CAPTEDRAFT_195136 [Capitella teleta]|eukprot:ELU16905.1 hypothetical protein CAPTEDRAFT_195136 [Capitella teleta]